MIDTRNPPHKLFQVDSWILRNGEPFFALYFFVSMLVPGEDISLAKLKGAELNNK
jgi:hypothetical protein